MGLGTASFFFLPGRGGRGGGFLVSVSFEKKTFLQFFEFSKAGGIARTGLPWFDPACSHLLMT